MKVQEILTGRSARILRLAHPKGGRQILPMIEKTAQRYHFTTSPSDLQKVLADQSLVFENGVFDDYMVKRVVVSDGVLICDVHATTTIADELAQDFYSWIIDEWGYRQKDDGYWAQAYASEIEFTLDPQTTPKLRAWMTLADKITKLVGDYGNEAAPYSLERISLAANPSSIGVRTIPFAIEHRNNTPAHLGIWYSAAPLKTDDHLAVLREITSS